NFRIHRLDRFCFFARDLFHRQSADAPSLSSSTTSTEAFIWYGHLSLPNNAAISKWDPTNPQLPGPAAGASWFNPAAPPIPPPTTDTPLYAPRLALGRRVMLRVPPPFGALPLESGFRLTALPPAGVLPLDLEPTKGATAYIGANDQSGSNQNSVPLYASR